MRFGSGSLTYEPVEGWGRLPEGLDLVEATGVGVDSQDRVYVFNRGKHPVVVFDAAGQFLASWGEGILKVGQGMCVGPDDSIYLADDGDHTVRKFSPEGKLLTTLGNPGQPSDTGYVKGDLFSVKRPGVPFNAPAGVALSPEGDIYVADGYGNCRVHRFSPDGRLLLSWGEPGNGPGQFRNPHGIYVDQAGTVYIGDRMNCRVQVFSPQGEFLSEWDDAYRPTHLFKDRDGHFYVTELGYSPDLKISGPVPAPEDSYPRVTIRDAQGRILASLTGPDPRVPGGLTAPHSACLDSHGNLYVVEVAVTVAKGKGLDPKGLHVLQKFARVA
ncbi:MAG: peptidyl-alpha-hydroxyglycine alpha-amidating lyase family protein [Chloroflexota bacterium]